MLQSQGSGQISILPMQKSKEDDIDNARVDGSSLSARGEREQRQPRFSWTPAYEDTFFRSLCESVSLGLRENNSFKAEAWERAAIALQATHDAYPTKNHLINKSDNARKRFRLWRGLREDPEFVYNPANKTVTASDDAWQAHIEREPLSRALRARPFHHEQYMEVLYPDVIGSGGAPKRVVRTRRRTDDASDEPDMPGTGIINLQTDQTQPLGLESEVDTPNRQQPQRPLLRQTPTGSSNGSLNSQPSVAANAVDRAMSSISGGILGGSTSALTPPDETLPQTQMQGRKRRQTQPPGSLNIGMSPPVAGNSHLVAQPPSATSPHKRRRELSRGMSLSASTPMASPAIQPSAAAPVAPMSGMNQTQPEVPVLSGTETALEELLDALRSRAAPRWRELSMEIFFRDFADEELDLQVKISENVLSNESKAMVFCKMPERVRRHWVAKFREIHKTATANGTMQVPLASGTAATPSNANPASTA